MRKVSILLMITIFLSTLISIGLSQDTILPQWRNQGQNTSYVLQGKAISLYAQGYDNQTGLRYAWLETNETGTWENKTIFYSNKFDNSLTFKNITFDGNENKTVYIELPKYSNVLDAKLNLSGFPTWSKKYNDTDASYACDGIYVELTCVGAVDEDITTGARCRPKSDVAGNVCNIYENYTVPPGATNVTMSARFRPTTGNISFWIWNYTNSSWKNIEPSRCWPYTDYITKTYNIPTDGVSENMISNGAIVNGIVMIRTQLSDCRSAVVRINETWIGWVEPKFVKVVEDRDSSYACDGIYVELTCVGAVDEDITTGARCRPKSDVAGNVCNIYENYTVLPGAINLTMSARFRPTTGNISFWIWNYTNSSWKNIEPSRCWPYTDYITKTYSIPNDSLNNITDNSTLMIRTQLSDCRSAVVRINETWITYYLFNPPDIYPNNTYLDVSGDGDMEWSHYEKFNITERTLDFSKEINDYLSTCAPNATGFCKVPLILHSNAQGIIELSKLNVTYISGNYITGFSNIKDQWLWSNFTWKNISIPADTNIAWRIHYQDAEGNRNSTGIMTFTVNNIPSWQNQGQNASIIFRGEPLVLYAQGYDETGLDYAWLETNETGEYEDKTSYGSPKGMAGWWNNDWNYKRQIIITENSGYNAIDYPINFTINTQELIAAGKMNPDCSDTRIVNEASSSTLDFGLDNCDNVNSVIAFKTDLSASQILTDIYIYYGNPSALPVNISFNDAYYELWDDFSTDSPTWDTSKWEQDKEYPNGCGGATRVDGTGRLWGCSNGWSYSVWSIQNFSASEGYHVTGRMNYDYSHCYPYVWLANATMVNDTVQTGGSRNNAFNSSFTMMVGSEDLRFVKYAIVLNKTLYSHTFAQWAAEFPWSGLSPDWRGFNFTFNPYDDEIDVCWNIVTDKTPVCGKTANNISTHMSDTKELKFSITCGYECTAYYSGKIEEFDDLFLRKWLPSEPSYLLNSEETAPITPVEWAWSNFTWQNSSVPEGTVVGWRIYYNDTFGAENVTDVMSFLVIECLSGSSCDDFNECTENICNATYQCDYPNKPQGTQCGSDRDCPSDACNLFKAELYPDDGHDECDGSGNCMEYSCNLETSYCTDNDPFDGINDLTCNAPCDQNEDCSETCSDKKWYSTYSCSAGCSCDLSDLICSVGHCSAECDENSDCVCDCLSNCTCFILAGNTNDDRVVDILDLIILGNAFGSTPGNSNWDDRADLKPDGIINVFDLSILGKNYGNTC